MIKYIKSLKFDLVLHLICHFTLHRIAHFLKKLYFTVPKYPETKLSNTDSSEIYLTVLFPEIPTQLSSNVKTILLQELERFMGLELLDIILRPLLKSKNGEVSGQTATIVFIFNTLPNHPASEDWGMMNELKIGLMNTVYTAAAKHNFHINIRNVNYGQCRNTPDWRIARRITTPVYFDKAEYLNRKRPTTETERRREINEIRTLIIND